MSDSEPLVILSTQHVGAVSSLASCKPYLAKKLCIFSEQYQAFAQTILCQRKLCIFSEQYQAFVQAVLSQKKLCKNCVKIVYQYQAFGQAILSSIQRTEKHHLSRGHHTEKCVQYTYVS